MEKSDVEVYVIYQELDVKTIRVEYNKWTTTTAARMGASYIFEPNSPEFMIMSYNLTFLIIKFVICNNRRYNAT